MRFDLLSCKSLISSFLFFALCFYNINSFAQSTTFRVKIQPYLAVTNQAFFRTLSLVSEPYSEFVQGFKFEWGYEYELEIRKIKLKNPPMDASNVNYELIRVISKTKAPADYTFTLQLVKFIQLDNKAYEPDELAFQPINDSTYSYFEGIKVVVPDTLKAAFDQTYTNGLRQKGEFNFANDSTIRLIRVF